MANRPDLLLIASCPPEVAIERLKKREKKDLSIFEMLSFLKKADSRYRSDWFKKLFEDLGSKVFLIDMARTESEEIADALSHLADLKNDS
jgi:thymidylate kinase